MTEPLTIALAQINPTVGDIDANVALVRAARERGAEQGADLVMTGELVISGYPPEDLVLKASFQEAIKDAVMGLAKDTVGDGPGLLISAPWVEDDNLYNAALLLDDGIVKAVVPKYALPNYGVFDEKRLFAPADKLGAVAFRGIRLGVMTCEDMWVSEVSQSLMQDGAEVLLVLNGSPFEMDKRDVRLDYAQKRVKETGLALVYVNQVGGQDELVFDGSSFVLNSQGEVTCHLSAFESTVATQEFHWNEDTLCPGTATLVPDLDDNEAIYQALVLGLQDYVNKNNFPGVMIGMSGGVDSAITAAVAVDALGPERVHLVMMPSPYTSQDSLDDAVEAARLLGTKLDEIAIEPAMEAFGGMLSGQFNETAADTTEENIQARSRGLILMAISNKFGYMVVSTGNKSEMSVGYATLYGDMCGGYNILKDVYKTRVYELCTWRNIHYADMFKGPQGLVVPTNIITKAPSAELKPDQTDQDTLPPYDDLDDMLYCLVEEEMPVRDIVQRGYDAAVVERVWRMLDRAEYKRRQAPPGVKITSRAFGRDRRYPLTNGFTA
ncbi:NAD+ synthase [Magnetovibrio sp. PR-2]|uniref:NAD+ synthase n=1 Tax=Magnetovibrio sp. PR-2 TaxID=3120356 RepID=UPI002FCE2797